jgi:hypothetical protein
MHPEWCYGTTIESGDLLGLRVAESIKIAQTLLDNSDLGTMPNTYTHLILDSQKRAVERARRGEFVLRYSDVLMLLSCEFEEKIPKARKASNPTLPWHRN